MDMSITTGSNQRIRSEMLILNRALRFISIVNAVIHKSYTGGYVIE